MEATEETVSEALDYLRMALENAEAGDYGLAASEAEYAVVVLKQAEEED